MTECFNHVSSFGQVRSSTLPDSLNYRNILIDAVNISVRILSFIKHVTNTKFCNGAFVKVTIFVTNLPAAFLRG